MPTPLKIPVLALALSLTGNAALVGYVALRSSSSSDKTAASHATSDPAAASASAAARRAGAAASTVSAETWKKAYSEDLPSLATNLRTAGLPDRLIRAIVNAELNERFKAREDALKPKNAPANYWESDDYYERNAGDSLEKRMARIDLRREKDALRRELLGEEPAKPDDKNPVPIAKRDALRRIAEDYDAMIEQTNGEARGFPLPSDKEKLAYLNAEKERELRELLTPDEYQAYQLRNSATARQLKWDLAGFKPTEEEFNLVFQLRQMDAELAKNPDNSYTQEDWNRRNAAEKTMKERLRQEMGDERYRDYERSRNYDYRQLTQLGTRLGLAPAAINEVYDQRRTVPEAAVEIARNPQLDRAAKEAALKQLAEKARQDTFARLGREGGEAYLRNNNSSQWLTALEKGTIIVQTDENSWSHYTLDNLPPSKTAGK